MKKKNWQTYVRVIESKPEQMFPNMSLHLLNTEEEPIWRSIWSLLWWSWWSCPAFLERPWLWRMKTLKLINGMVSDELRAGDMISVEYYAETPGNPYVKWWYKTERYRREDAERKTLRAANEILWAEWCPGILFFLRDTCIPADRRPKVPCLLLPG